MCKKPLSRVISATFKTYNLKFTGGKHGGWVCRKTRCFGGLVVEFCLNRYEFGMVRVIRFTVDHYYWRVAQS